MRTTLTLDQDVANGLMAEVRRSGRPLEEILNELLRHVLESGKPSKQASFTIQAPELGALRQGLSIDNIGDLLDSVEGPTHR